MTSASMALLGYFCKDGTGGNASLRAFADRQGFDLDDHAVVRADRRSPAGVHVRRSVAHQRVLQGGLDRHEPLGPVRPGRRRHQGVSRARSATASGCALPTWRFASRAATATTCSRRRSPSSRTCSASMDEPDDEHAADARTVALHRLRFLRSVGLGYLQMDRATWTLSAGEAQRIKLASVLGGGLVGMTVLLDEPSRGLHPSEVGALAGTLTELRDAGNTVIAVEHDATLIRAADDVIEIGPGPGRAGGRLIDLDSDESVTRAVLRRTRLDPSPRPPRADRVDARHGSAGEQPAWPRRAHPARRAGRRLRCVRVGKVLARRRHDRAGAGATEDRHPRPRRHPRRARRSRHHLRRAPPERSSPTRPGPRSPHPACSSGSSTPSASPSPRAKWPASRASRSRTSPTAATPARAKGRGRRTCRSCRR